jgi:RND family efflux transporter MFP subunit
MRLSIPPLLIVTALASCGPSEVEHEAASAASWPSAETMVVEPMPLETVVPVDGTIAARQEAVLSTRSMARITSIEVEVGDDVREGQVLVRLGTDDLSVSRQRAEAALLVARAAHEEAARHAARMDTLHAQDAVALVQRDQARLALVQAESQVALAEAAVQEVEAAARYSLIQAPFDGAIVSRSARVGDLAAPGMALLSVAAHGPREVVLGVPADVAHGLALGDEIVVRGEAAGHATGRVRAVAPGADPHSRTVEVRVDLPASWPVGVSVTALVPAGAHEGIVIPASAVVRRGQLTGVRVVGEGGEALRWIRLGRQIETAGEHGEVDLGVEVLSGLTTGERIAL